MMQKVLCSCERQALTHVYFPTRIAAKSFVGSDLGSLEFWEAAWNIVDDEDYWRERVIGGGYRHHVSASVDVCSDVGFFLYACFIDSSLYFCASYSLNACLHEGLKAAVFFNSRAIVVASFTVCGRASTRWETVGPLRVGVFFGT